MRFTGVKSPVPNEQRQGALAYATARLGFYGNVFYGPFEFRNIRVDPKVRGYNIATWSGRRTRALSWGDWVEFNAVVNEVLDRFGISANVRGKRAYTEEDWGDLKWENVGSVARPMSRAEAISHA